MKHRFFVPFLAASLLLAGCSDGDAPSPNAAGTTPPGTATSSPPGGTKTPGATSPGPAASTPKPGSGSSASPQPTGSPFPTAAPLNASIDKTCVQRGVSSDMQGLTVHVGAGDTVGYITFYSDGSSASSNPALGGGGAGNADNNGTFRRTWVVPSGAPLGKARLVASSGNAGAQFLFTVVDPGQACP